MGSRCGPPTAPGMRVAAFTHCAAGIVGEVFVLSWMAATTAVCLRSRSTDFAEIAIGPGSASPGVPEQQRAVGQLIRRKGAQLGLLRLPEGSVATTQNLSCLLGSLIGTSQSTAADRVPTA
jgi:hypothetical protein